MKLIKRIERLEQHAPSKRLDELPSGLFDRLLKGAATEAERRMGGRWLLEHLPEVPDEQIESLDAATGLYLIPADKYV